MIRFNEENIILCVLVDVGVTPALRRRRERAERQRSFIREQQEATANLRASLGHTDDQESEYDHLKCSVWISFYHSRI